MKIERTFFAVGHGGFYVERIEDKVIVFDCGSTNKAIINKAIQRAFGDSNVNIDAIFISHFHMDHINGLAELLKSHTVHKIFVPYFSKIERLWMLYSIDNKRDLFEQKFILDPIKALQEISCKTTKIIYVKPNSQIINNYDLMNLDDNVIEGSCIKVLSFWKYIPVYRNEIDQKTKEESEEKLVNKKISSIKKNATDEKLKEVSWQKEMIPILKRYLTSDDYNFENDKVVQCINAGEKKWFKNLLRGILPKAYDVNMYSMVLYSAPINNCVYSNIGFNVYNELDYSQTCIPKFRQTLIHRLGCLYFGDYNLLDQKGYDFVKNIYSKYISQLGIIQVPHHGSKKSFNEEIISRWQVCIIPAAEKDRNKHPDPETIKAILDKQGIIIMLGTTGMDVKDVNELIVIDNSNNTLLEHYMY